MESVAASPDSKIAEAYAVLEAVEAALDGQPVSDFMLSFPVVAKAFALHGEAKARSGVVVDYMLLDTQFGKYDQATVTSDGRLEGVGVSRYRNKAFAYALEDLAEKVRRT